MVFSQDARIDTATAAEETQEAIAQPAETHVFLLQAQLRADAVVAQIVIEGSLFGRQPVQVQPPWLVLSTPDGSMRIEGCPVHQERIHMIKVASQLVQDAEAMGVDVAPAINCAVLQPMAAPVPPSRNQCQR